MCDKTDILQLIPTTEEEASYFYKRKFSIVNGMHTVLGFMTLREKAPGVRPGLGVSDWLLGGCYLHTYIRRRCCTVSAPLVCCFGSFFACAFFGALYACVRMYVHT